MSQNMVRIAVLILGTLIGLPGSIALAGDRPLEGVRRAVFLGDSITYSGQYIEFVETLLRLRHPGLECEFLDLGLPSETVSGLSEPGHAGGKFPRPDLHERLDRVLAKTKPNLVVVCYGMNDGIYAPFSEERFQAFQQGIRDVRAKAEAVGARLLHLTPPPFDPAPILEKTLPAGLAEYRQPYRGYDTVLERYAGWLLDQKANGWDVVDLHGPLSRVLAEKRKADPNFRFANDGVHMSADGHWIAAREILTHWGVPANDLTAETGTAAVATFPHGLEALKLVQSRQRLLKDAWLTATRHTRPGMKQGLPLEDAERRAATLDSELAALLAVRP